MSPGVQNITLQKNRKTVSDALVKQNACLYQPFCFIFTFGAHYMYYLQWIPRLKLSNLVFFIALNATCTRKAGNSNPFRYSAKAMVAKQKV